MQQLLPWISPVLCAVTLILALLLLARIRRMERENAADAAREAVERLRAEMEASENPWKPATRQRKVTKALRAYAKMAASADKGAVRVVED